MGLRHSFSLPTSYLSSQYRLQVPNLGLDAARENVKKKVQDIHFEPKSTSLDQPKEGEHDDKEHSGGNRWAGGVSSHKLKMTKPILR